jgi:hypothetical protein
VPNFSGISSLKPCAKCGNNRSIGDVGMVFQTWENSWMKDGPWALLHGVEVNLVAGASIGTLKVGRELMAQLFPRSEGPLG